MPSEKISELGDLKSWRSKSYLILLLVIHFVTKVRCKNREENKYYKKKWILFLCVVYIAVILKLAYFSREPGSRTSVDMRLFGTWGVTTADHAYVIDNILMFLLFGILFRFAFHIFRNLIVCIATGFICSVGVEFIQFVTERGYCQLDDIVMNTLGTLIGWVIYKIASLWIRRDKKE